ncbi:hypothetical protein B0H15DRAFT_659498 [Mycena belliarum]|uniref:F-box domain-containing protein n=1 Tax=Mycena belliarum TaxID=1033014 RepID=A0AAD6TRZ2_9AGAR|nr:hypothetical protein B0H15DRAFT_659498 [Mycena belliae]
MALYATEKVSHGQLVGGPKGHASHGCVVQNPRGIRKYDGRTPHSVSRIDKVMNKISQMPSDAIALEDRFKFLDRADSLMTKWDQLLEEHRSRGMHRCLKIVELVDMICFHLLPRRKRSLAALARTCKAFHEQALDHLWHDQETLCNVLRCMPGVFDTYHAPSPIAGPNHCMRLLRPIVASDWLRPLDHARRVKHLKIDSHPGAPLDPSLSEILPVLSQCLPSHSLFPNLRTLRWNPGSSEFIYMPMVVNPSLTTLFFECEPTSTNLSILSTLPRSFTTLRNLSIGVVFDSDPTRSAVSSFVQAIGNVQSLSLAIPDLAAFQHIGRLLSLVTLHVTSFALIPSTLHVPAPNFAALKKLSLEICVVHEAHNCTTSFDSAPV